MRRQGCLARGSRYHCGHGEVTEGVNIFEYFAEDMLEVGVHSVLEKHGYRCSYDRDKEFLTSWLEALVLLKRLRIDIDSIRSIMDTLTWHPTLEVTMVNTPGSLVHFCRFEGTLEVNGVRHTFTPFPRWVGVCHQLSQARSLLTAISQEDGKYSAKIGPETTK